MGERETKSRRTTGGEGELKWEEGGSSVLAAKLPASMLIVIDSPIDGCLYLRAW